MTKRTRPPVDLFAARCLARPSSRDRDRIREGIERALASGAASQTVLHVDASMAERALGAVLATRVFSSNVALAKLLVPAVLIGAGVGAMWARILFAPHAQPEPTSRSMPAEVEDVGDDELPPSTMLAFDEAHTARLSVESIPLAASAAKPLRHRTPHHARARSSNVRPVRPAPVVTAELTPVATDAEQSSPSETPSHHLAEELRLMRAASAALSASDSSRTLSLLAQHAQLFPDGALREERRAMRIISLCKLGSSHFALVERDEFLSSSPRSLLTARVREACELPE